ncbi:hypothetical protein J6590_076909 [Homalodisca vitripennis]|nr:hypothetical protein J6590_076909 [Homalodisca vitripennis]
MVAVSKGGRVICSESEMFAKHFISRGIVGVKLDGKLTSTLGKTCAVLYGISLYIYGSVLYIGVFPNRYSFTVIEVIVTVYTLAPSVTLNLGTNGLKVTSEPPSMAGQAGCLQGQDRSAVTHPVVPAT